MLKNIIILLISFCAFLNAQTISLDSEHIVVNLKNNSTNVLNFPFVIQKANLTTETPKDFIVSSKNKTTVILPTAELPDSESGDLLVWSSSGEPYLIKIHVSGKKEQIFNFVSNSVKDSGDIRAARFETGRIDFDIKKIIKRLVLGKEIPGYKKVNVKKHFLTPDLDMQKEYFYDGGKYRAEQWYVKNISNDTLLLDYENFYAPGVLAISFEKKTLKPNQIGKAWLIIDKNTLSKELESRQIK